MTSGLTKIILYYRAGSTGYSRQRLNSFKPGVRWLTTDVENDGQSSGYSSRRHQLHKALLVSFVPCLAPLHSMKMCCGLHGRTQQTETTPKPFNKRGKNTLNWGCQSHFGCTMSGSACMAAEENCVTPSTSSKAYHRLGSGWLILHIILCYMPIPR